MNIILMRHSLTSGNERNVYSGVTDDLLSIKGIELAHACGSREDVKAVAVSTLRRTSETAAICFPNARQTAYDGLREMDFGSYEGHTVDEIPKLVDWQSNPEIKCPCGESIADVANRATATLASIVDDGLKSEEHELAVVSHGVAIATIMYSFFPVKNNPLEWFVGNCHGYFIEVDEALWRNERKFAGFEKFIRL